MTWRESADTPARRESCRDAQSKFRSAAEIPGEIRRCPSCSYDMCRPADIGRIVLIAAKVVERSWQVCLRFSQMLANLGRMWPQLVECRPMSSRVEVRLQVPQLRPAFAKPSLIWPRSGQGCATLGRAWLTSGRHVPQILRAKTAALACFRSQFAWRSWMLPIRAALTRSARDCEDPLRRERTRRWHRCSSKSELREAESRRCLGCPSTGW